MQPPDESRQSENIEEAMKRYDLVLKLFAMDTQIYWMRSQLFIVANSVLAGFILNTVPLGSDSHTVKIWAAAIGATTGILLCVLWKRGLRSGEGWMNHWKTTLKKWEPLLFPDDKIYRDLPASVTKSSGAARGAANLFLALWCLLSTYIALCLYLRFSGCPLP